MNYQQLSELANLLSKPFAEELFRILVSYYDISSSEAASRLDVHIQTAQDFLEGLHQHGLTERVEVMEGKRPYYRYKLKKKKIHISFDLGILKENSVNNQWQGRSIKEKANNKAIFSSGGGRQDFISSVSLFTGEGRNRKERRINLTRAQGKFLFNLPFPNMEAQPVPVIMKKAGVEKNRMEEIIDLLNLLYTYEIIEIKKR